MRRFALYFSLCVGFACTASVLAGVGTTSAGVTTTDPNNPSANVEQQSSGFVTTNQQLQNGAAAGIALPAGVAGTAQAGQTGAANTNASAAHDGSNPAAEHTPPAAPPPPPPTYESRIKPVTPTPVVAPTPAPALPGASAAPVPKPVQALEKPADKLEAKPAPVPAANPDRAAAIEKKQDEAMAASTADPGGGRGASPDGYTFWFGLLIAGALLALAAVTWLRIQRGETPG